MGRHGNSRADHRSEGTQTSSQQPSNLSRVLSQARRSQPAQHRAEAPSPVEEKKPVRARVPAVTSKARTTAPERKDARRNRRKYPRWVFLRQVCAGMALLRKFRYTALCDNAHTKLNLMQSSRGLYTLSAPTQYLIPLYPSCFPGWGLHAACSSRLWSHEE